MLSQKALIVYVRISQWTGRKLDKKATGHVEANFETERAVGQYTKKLLPGAAELDRVHSIAGSMRKFVHERTLPWMSDGARLVSSKAYIEFQNEFRKRKGEFDTAVEAFLKVYPQLRTIAQIKLGQLFNDLEYPSEAKLRLAFRCDVRFMPVPEVSDFRTEVLDSEKDAFIKSMREVETNATRECWQRLFDVVSKAARRLEQPNAIFRDTLIENISELCAVLPKLNITENPDLENARLEIAGLVAKVHPETCRTNETVRAETAKQLTEITERMGSFMGGI